MGCIQGNDPVGTGDEEKPAHLVEREPVRLFASGAPARNDLLSPDVNGNRLGAFLQVGVEKSAPVVHGIALCGSAKSEFGLLPELLWIRGVEDQQ